MQKTRVLPSGREDLLEREMATHSSILAWRIPWTEEPGGLQSTRSQRVRHDWAYTLCYATFIWNHPYITIFDRLFPSWSWLVSSPMVILIYVKKADFLRAAYGQFTGYIMDVFHHIFNRLVDNLWLERKYIRTSSCTGAKENPGQQNDLLGFVIQTNC